MAHAKEPDNSDQISGDHKLIENYSPSLDESPLSLVNVFYSLSYVVALCVFEFWFRESLVVY